jgi:hypothetical protein
MLCNFLQLGPVYDWFGRHCIQYVGCSQKVFILLPMYLSTDTWPGTNQCIKYTLQNPLCTNCYPEVLKLHTRFICFRPQLIIYKALVLGFTRTHRKQDAVSSFTIMLLPYCKIKVYNEMYPLHLLSKTNRAYGHRWYVIILFFVHGCCPAYLFYCHFFFDV